VCVCVQERDSLPNTNPDQITPSLSLISIPVSEAEVSHTHTRPLSVSQYFSTVSETPNTLIE